MKEVILGNTLIARQAVGPLVNKMIMCTSLRNVNRRKGCCSRHKWLNSCNSDKVRGDKMARDWLHHGSLVQLGGPVPVIRVGRGFPFTGVGSIRSAFPLD